MAQLSPNDSTPVLFSDGGEMGQRVRAFDWASTPLGPIRSWPQALITATAICLGARQPTILWWGDDLTLIYNDACIPLLDHPAALGTSAATLLSTMPNVDSQALRDENGIIRGGLRIADAISAGVMSAIFNQVTVGIAQTDVDGRVEVANDRFCEILGRTREQIIGLSMKDATHPDDLSNNLMLFARLLEEKTPFVLEKRYLRPDGSSVWVRNCVSGIVGPTGRVEHVVAVTIDITEKRRLLEANETYFRLLVDRSPAILWLTRPDGVTTYVSSQWFERTGTTAGQSNGFGWLDSIHPEDRQTTSEVFLAANSARKPFQMDYRLRHGNGEYRWVSDAGNPRFDDDGVFMGMVGTVIDIHERRHFQEEMQRHADELLRSNAELSRFAYVASHDLKEPLRVVTNYVQLLARANKGRLDPRSETYMKYVTDGTARMAELINDLLSYSRVSANPLEMTEVDLNDTVETAVSNLEAGISESKARILYAELPTIIADRTQMAQLFQNLIGNAIKYRSAEVAPTIRIDAKREDACWILSVEDNGIGIAAEYHEKIFALFQRLHNRDKYAGTGIGLAVCKKIAESHQGRIWVESTPGQGSIFRIQLGSA